MRELIVLLGEHDHPKVGTMHAHCLLNYPADRNSNEIVRATQSNSSSTVRFVMYRLKRRNRPGAGKGDYVGDNPSSIDEHASLTLSAIGLDSKSATSTAVNAIAPRTLWRQGLRLEAVANLAHELRTPVQVLLGYVDILRDDHAPEFRPRRTHCWIA